jgi:hypothetical protein
MVSLFVRIGSLRPLSRKRVTPGTSAGGGGGATVAGGLGGGAGRGGAGRGGAGKPIRTTGEKAWHSVYSALKGIYTNCQTKK